MQARINPVLKGKPFGIWITCVYDNNTNRYYLLSYVLSIFYMYSLIYFYAHNNRNKVCYRFYEIQSIKTSFFVLHFKLGDFEL